MNEQLRESALEVISRSIQDFSMDNDQMAVSLTTSLFGEGAVIDSLTLVNIIVDLEELVDMQCGFAVSLTDDDAVFRDPSPYSTVGSLIDFICELVSKQ